MHPLGSIDILLAAGGSFHPSFAFLRQSLRSSIVCLSVTLTPLTPTNILKYLIYDYGHHFFSFLRGRVYPSPSCSARRAIYALAGLARAIFCHGDGRALDLSQYLPNRLKSLPVPARGPACCLGSRGGERGETERGMARNQNA